MLLLSIFALVFGSVALLSWELTPAGARRYDKFQTKRVKRDAHVLDKMFLAVPKQKLRLIYIFSPLVLGGAGFILSQSAAVGFIAAAFGVILPTLIIRIIKKRRLAKFGQQLIDGLMVLSSSLKGGLSLIQSIEVMVEEMPPPLSQEFSLAMRENKMGVSLDESLNRMNKRIKSEELNLVVTAIDIARETGGNLTEPFEKLMISMRDKAKLMGKVKTLTLQAKLQGVIMSLMPIVFGIVVFYMNPGFFDIMIKSSMGQMLLVAAGILEVVGAFLLFKLSKVEI
jgi:tight adherence protein B